MLIADSGATKTDWALVQEGKPVYVRTGGLHPAYMNPENMAKELNSAFGKFTPDIIYFYGAGCYSEEASRPVYSLFSQLFGSVPVEIRDDLTAAAHAFLGAQEGIVGILGTGSASGYYKHGKCVKQVASLGYVMGDEGSAADIGRRLLKSLFRDELSRDTAGYLESVAGPLEYRTTIQQLYSSEKPSYFLARFTEKVLKGNFPIEVKDILIESLEAFAEAHLKKYEGFPTAPLILTGGIATSRLSEVEQVLQEYSVEDYSIRSDLIASLAERRMEEKRL